MYIVQMIDGLVVGGAQQLQITFAREARKHGHKLAVLSLSPDDGSHYPDQLKRLGVAVYFFPTTRIFDFDNLGTIVKWFKSERPDILHTHLTYANILGSIAGFLTRTPVVATLHNTGVEEKFHAPRTEFVERFALRHVVSRIIACGPAVSQYVQTFIKNKSILNIPNAIDPFDQEITLAERAQLRTEIAGDAEYVIISVGRLVAQKGFDDLIKAFAKLHPLYPGTCLVVAGDGHLRGELEEKINALGLSEHIRLLGRRSDISQLLSVSDLFVLASRWEGLPIAVLEAMTVGLPVLATDVGDNAWAIGPAGVTVPSGRPEILAETMMKLLDDPTRRKTLGQAANMRIRENFNPSAWFDKIFSVYENVLR